MAVLPYLLSSKTGSSGTKCDDCTLRRSSKVLKNVSVHLKGLGVCVCIRLISSLP